MSRRLLLDIGNSRIKSAWAGNAADGPLHALPTVAHGSDAAAALADVSAEAPDSLWISHVLGSAAESRLDEAAWTRWGVRPRYARARAQFMGLVSGYAEPARLGVDRWLAMLAARRGSPGALLVVDAGTALTADRVDAQGQHLGGFIAAGLQTAQKGLLGSTRFETRDAAERYDDGLGHDTEGCVRQGAMLACLGAIDRVSDSDSDASPLRRVITGGDADVLLPYLRGHWQHRPALVMEGLSVVAFFSGDAESSSTGR